MRAKYLTSRSYPKLDMKVPSAADMFYMFAATGAGGTTFFLILMPFLPTPALQIVAIAAGVGVAYFVRYSPRIARRTRIALAYRRSINHR